MLDKSKIIMKKLLIFCLLCFTLTGFSQLNVNVYTPDYFGLGVRLFNKLTIEQRVSSTKASQTLVTYQVFQKDYYKINLGLGASYYFLENDGFEGLNVPIQFEITPFKKYDFISFILEPALFFGDNFDFKNSLGIRVRL